MNKNGLVASFYERYKALKGALQGDDLPKIKELALEVHALTHPAEVSGRTEKTIADYVAEFLLAGNQNILVPRKTFATDLHYDGTETVPLCWQFWHTYRIEDLVGNILMADGKQNFDEAWQKKINSPITDTGNALEFGEAAAFGRRICVQGLWEYMLAVGKNTRRILQELTLDQIKHMVPEERVMRILEEGGVTTDFRSVWLLVFWGRLTVGEMILTPITNHHMMHLPVCFDLLPDSLE